MRAALAWVIGVPLLAACGAHEAGKLARLETDDQKANYSIGYQMGGDFKRQGVPLESDALVAGLRDALDGKEAMLSEEERKQSLVALRKKLMEQEKQALAAEGEKNLAAAKAFLDANKAKEGVKTTPSGLQYKVLSEGKGDKPAATNVVTVNYRGSLIDGTEFDSSYSRGEPATFPLDRVIPGWTEALQLMPEGSKWELYLPPDLAYGDQGAGDRIPPQSALIFEVELIDAKVDTGAAKGAGKGQ
jgi:FKBP-type peptidyl-prolyl cis-trans isomerase